MNSRTRVLKTLAHEEPDCVPFNLRPSKGMVEYLQKEQNRPDLDFTEYFHHDVCYVHITFPKPPKGIPAKEWQWQLLPDASEIAICEKQVKSLHNRGVAVCSSYVCGIFEQMKESWGDVDTLTMPVDKPAFLEKELQTITEWKKSVYCSYVRAGVDIVWIGDDLGMQQNLIMSPSQYRQWYRPCHASIINAIRKIRSDVRIAFHCCGYVTPLIPDLIEIGIDILESVQPECMDIATLKKEFGQNLSFWGGVGVQSVLARTNPDEVQEGVRQTMETLSPGGGYIAAPCHTLTEEVSQESVLAFYQAVKRYGIYSGMR